MINQRLEKSGFKGASFMNRCILVTFCLAAIFICASCWGPKKSVEEEKVLATLSNIQGNLETSISYQQFQELLGRAKIEIDTLKRSGKNNLCFNFYLLTLLAFFFHQIFELTDRQYQECREKHGSKRHMWESLRAYIKI